MSTQTDRSRHGAHYSNLDNAEWLYSWGGDRVPRREGGRGGMIDDWQEVTMWWWDGRRFGSWGLAGATGAHQKKRRCVHWSVAPGLLLKCIFNVARGWHMSSWNNLTGLFCFIFDFWITERFTFLNHLRTVLIALYQESPWWPNHTAMRTPPAPPR